MKKDTVILFVSHILNDKIVSRYHALKDETCSFADIFLLIQKNGDEILNVPEDINYYPFSVESLNELDYNPIRESIVPGSNHFALLQFYRDYPLYDYYWNIEYDVCFSGKWSFFFDKFSFVEADFLSSHIQIYPDYPEWAWWNTLEPQLLPIPQADYIKSFNPIYRITNRALALIDSMQVNGFRGHHEVLIPTLLNHYNLKIVDFGGNGKFVLPGYEEQFYLSEPNKERVNIGGTMSYRPVFESVGDVPDKLYHPVK